MTSTATNAACKLPLFPLSSLLLPSLPVIEDTAIERKVFTHSSFVAKQRSGTLKFDEEDESSDNEKLEHVGDSILGTAVTLLLHDLYPTMNPGTATRIKGSLVSNESLRQISHYYHLPLRLLAPAESLPVLRNGDRVPANLFEAYVAGLYYSCLSHGIPSTTLPTPPRSPHDDISSNGTVHTPAQSTECSSARIRVSPGEVRQYLEQHWLRPLFTPLAQWTLEQFKAGQTRGQAQTEDEADIDRKAIGAVAHLNTWFTYKEGGIPEYPCMNSGSQGWTAQCIAKDRDGHVWYGEATRATKQSAKGIAAYKVCLQFAQAREGFHFG
ncbi:hypothetical protein IAU60_006276 [Kwoniella sp. DSM 27419]